MINLTYISPSFIVESLEASVAFYVDKLGFEVRLLALMRIPSGRLLAATTFLSSLKQLHPILNPFQIIHAMGGPVGMRMSQPRTLISYLKNIVPAV